MLDSSLSRLLSCVERAIVEVQSLITIYTDTVSSEPSQCLSAIPTSAWEDEMPVTESIIRETLRVEYIYYIYCYLFPTTDVACHFRSADHDHVTASIYYISARNIILTLSFCEIYGADYRHHRQRTVMFLR